MRRQNIATRYFEVNDDKRSDNQFQCTFMKYNIVGKFNILVGANAARGARTWCLQVCDIQPQNWSEQLQYTSYFSRKK